MPNIYCNTCVHYMRKGSKDLCRYYANVSIVTGELLAGSAATDITTMRCLPYSCGEGARYYKPFGDKACYTVRKYVAGESGMVERVSQILPSYAVLCAYCKNFKSKNYREDGVCVLSDSFVQDTHASNHYRPGQSWVCKQLCDYGKRFEHNGYTLQDRRHKLFFRATVTSVIEVVALLIGSSLTAYVLTGAVSWVLNMVFLLTGVIMFIYRLGYVHTHTNCHVPIPCDIGRQDKDAVNG
jgi:hypothetical protein